MPGDRLRAERPDHVWAIDFQFDVTDDGRAVKLLYIVDEFTREALAMIAERRIDADKVVAALEQVVSAQGRRPDLVRCDNGPEMTSNALRDRCRFSGAGTAFIEPGSPWENPFVDCDNGPEMTSNALRDRCRFSGAGTAFIEPGPPWENPFVESFNSRVRDELLSVEVFSCLAEVKVMLEDFRVTVLVSPGQTSATFEAVPETTSKREPVTGVCGETSLPSVVSRK